MIFSSVIYTVNKRGKGMTFNRSDTLTLALMSTIRAFNR